MFRVTSFSLGRFVAAEDPFRGDGHRLGRQPGGGQLGIAGGRAPGHLAIFLQGLFQLAELLLQRVADQELGPRCLVRAGIFRDQPPPGGNGLVPLLLGDVLLVHQQEDRGAAGVQADTWPGTRRRACWPRHISWPRTVRRPSGIRSPRSPAARRSRHCGPGTWPGTPATRPGPGYSPSAI